MAWKTTNEVIEAVRIGGAVTEDELRYAVRNLSIWHRHQDEMDDLIDRFVTAVERIADAMEAR